jgi:hypothetical protein
MGFNIGFAHHLLFSILYSQIVLDEVRQAEEEHREKSMTRAYLKKMDPFIKGVEQYGKALDVITNAKPEVLSLLWGGCSYTLARESA